MTLDFSRCRLPPFQHQREDTEWLLKQPFALVASEMRTGKSKTVLDAAQFLHVEGVIDRVIIIAPAPVRDVWFDETFGEIQKHVWADLHITVTEYSGRIRTWVHPGENPKSLDFYVSNFEFIRSGKTIKLDAKTSVPARLAELIPLCGPRTLLIGDESSFLKNWTAQQTKAFVQLRKRCGWCWLLNGTPIFHSPMDLFSQANILNSSILDCPYITLFKARYAIQTPVLERGKPMKRYNKIVYEVDGWTNLDDLERRLKPYTVRRLQKDCLDLPPKLDPVTLTATLEPETWKAYKEMRDELVVWLTNSRVATSASAAVKALRLSQITGGFIGGVENANIDPIPDDTNVPEGLLDQLEFEPNGPDFMVTQNSSVEIGREKLDVLLWLIEQQLEKDPNLHLVAWTRFRAEAFRMVSEVSKKFPQFQTGLILGGQKKSERLASLSLLHPDTSPKGPVFIGGIEGTGSFGLNMTASHTCVTMSSGYSIGRVAQTLDRVYGPGQTQPISYYNIIAVGPRGQRTIDHDILATRLTGENIANRTTEAWVRAVINGEGRC